MVTNDGLGSCLSRSRERSNSPISCPPDDRPGEFGGGDLHNDASRHFDLSTQPQPQQQSAQLHNSNPNPTISTMSSTQQNRPNTPSKDQNVLPQSTNNSKKQEKKIEKNT
jgi:hypothetical protein